ncbi:Ig-like domain-containing protein, partial [Flavobacterium sp. 7A]|uniref:Ig-like domain-containing protein n=1 Tax=Flavobacterium sp. 7A TaxID=2940571 RepID=UPI0022271326
TTPVLTATTTYYVTVTGTSTCENTSGTAKAVTVTVNPASVGGTIADTTPVCTGTNSTTLTLSGYTGTITGWESSLDGFVTAGTAITNATTTLTVENLTATTSYRAIIKSGMCPEIKSSVGTVKVNPKVALNGSASANCETNGVEYKVTFTVSGSGAYVATGTGAPGTWDGATWTSDVISTSTPYNVNVQDVNKCNTLNVAGVAPNCLCPAAATVTGGGTACEGTTVAVRVALLGNAPWSITYTDGTTPTTITGILTSPYTINASTTGTYSVSSVSDKNCTGTATGSAKVTIDPTSVGGKITGAATVCAGTNSTTLTLSGYTGTIIGWESSLDGFTTAGTSIVNTTNTLTATNLTATTSYRAIIKSGLCSSTTSEAVIVNVNLCTTPDINAGNVNTVIPGNVSTNDTVPVGTTYGSPLANASNPSTEVPVFNPDGTYVFTTPTAGVYVFNVPVCVPGAIKPCPTETLTITVVSPLSNVNPPIANNDTAVTLVDKPVVIAVKGNDGAGNIGGILGNPTTIMTAPANGTAVINTDGTITYTPTTGFTGTDSFVYTICETPSGLCANATVEVDVLPLGSPNSTHANDDYVSTTGQVPANGNVLT